MNDGDGGFTGQPVGTAAGSVTSLAAADVDGDGDLDVVVGLSRGGGVVWFENDGKGDFAEQQRVGTASGDVPSLAAADVDGDGDLDVVVGLSRGRRGGVVRAGFHPFALTDTDPANAAFDVARGANVGATFDAALDQLTVSTSTFTVRGSQTGERDGTFSVSENGLTFDPAQDFLPGEVVTVTASSQVRGSGGEQLVPYSWQFSAQPERGSGAFAAAAGIGGTDASDAFPVYTGDLDGDGDLDVVATLFLPSRVAWFDNDGEGGFTERPISGPIPADAALSAYAADVDGDGALDVVAGFQSGAVTWFKNDGGGGFTGQPVGTAAGSVTSLAAADVDGDGDLDVVAGLAFSGEVVWFENDGGGGFTDQSVGTAAGSARSLAAADVDGDGDLDVVAGLRSSGAGSSGGVVWFENDGDGGFTGQPAITTADRVLSLAAADVDGDGDLDVVAGLDDFASGGIRGVLWFMNDGGGGFTQRTVDADAGLAESLAAADVDGDGDLDVVVGLSRGGGVVWYANDGSGGFTDQSVGTTASDAYSVAAADVDGDGDLDVVAGLISSGGVVWYEQLPSLALTDTDPDNAAFDVARWANVGATFDAALEQSTVSTNTFTVRGSQTGDRDGAFSVSGSGLTFDPDSSFKPGELVTVTASSQVRGSGGEQLVPYSWQFSAQPERGSGTFASGMGIGGTDATQARAVYPADVDGDGDLDVVAGLGSAVRWLKNDGDGGFTDQPVGTASGSVVYSLAAADVDGDGDLDVVAGFQSGAVTWFKNDGGGGFTGQPVGTVSGFVNSLAAADVDGDGDLDVVVAAADGLGGGGVVWYANDGDGGFTGQPVGTTAGNLTSLAAADVDGDGDLDVVAGLFGFGGGGVVWFEHDGDGGFTDQPAITTAGNVLSLAAADVDGDGDLDVVAGLGSAVRWLENDGDGGFTDQPVGTASGSVVYSLAAADVDGDGDLDVVAGLSSNGGVVWFENDGEGDFAGQQRVGTTAGNVFSLAAADVDGDGDLDVVAGLVSNGGVVWFEQTAPSFALTQADPANAAFDVARGANVGATFDADLDQSTVSTNTFTVRGSQTGERDGAFSFAGSGLTFDPAQDFKPGEVVTVTATSGITSAAGTSLTPYAWQFSAQSEAGPGTFGDQQVISTSADGATSVYAADLDGDGLLDVLSASFGDDKIAWYPNEGGGAFGSEQVITTSANSARSVYAADVDGDGDVDVLSASRDDDKIAWYENTGGGVFDPEQQVITTSAARARSVYAADVDGDGDVDVLSASSRDNKIAWYPNEGSGTFGDQQVISTSADGATSVYAADVDGDGDLDVLSASFNDNKIAWYVNTGRGVFDPKQQVITTSAALAWSVYAADIDGDGDVDVLSASVNDDKIAWYENTGGGVFDPEQQVITTSADAAFSVYAADVDGDGDVDVLSASGVDDKIAWYANDGTGVFGDQQVITTSADDARSVYAADMDGDGDLDVLSGSAGDSKIAWYEQTLPTAEITGDAGWRMLSAPMASFTPSEIADDIAIQGIPGGADEGSPSNVFYRPATGDWTTPAGMTDALPTGLGYIAYVYDNDLGTSTPLPDTLDVSRTAREPQSDVSVALAQGGFTLLGNPFALGLSVDDLAGDAGSGLQDGLVSPIQVWDDGTGTPEARVDVSTTGSFVTYNLGEGQVVAPWQGFMLESAAARRASPFRARPARSGAPTSPSSARTASRCGAASRCTCAAPAAAARSTPRPSSTSTLAPARAATATTAPNWCR